MFSVAYKTLVILIIHFYRTSAIHMKLFVSRRIKRKKIAAILWIRLYHTRSMRCHIYASYRCWFCLRFYDFPTIWLELLWPCGMSFFVILSVGASTSHEWRRWSKPQSKWWWTLTELYCVNPNTFSAIMTTDQVFG